MNVGICVPTSVDVKAQGLCFSGLALDAGERSNYTVGMTANDIQKNTLMKAKFCHSIVTLKELCFHSNNYLA